MVRETFRLSGSNAMVTLQSQKNVAALPAPVQAVEIRVERMVCGKLPGVGGIGRRIRPNMKAHTAVSSCGQVFEADKRAAARGIHPGVLARQLNPGTIGSLQGE